MVTLQNKHFVMKKFKYIASIFAALGMLSVSCENERDTNLPDAAVYIVNDGLQVSETFYAVDESAKRLSGYFAPDISTRPLRHPSGCRKRLWPTITGPTAPTTNCFRRIIMRWTRIPSP